MSFDQEPKAEGDGLPDAAGPQQQQAQQQQHPAGARAAKQHAVAFAADVEPSASRTDASISIADDAGSQPSSSDAAAVSVYDLTEKRRYAILIAVSVGSMLVPFTDTIYLPALQAVGQDLHADASLVAASVAIYMFTVGIGSVFWGPLSDRFGRNLTYYISEATFLATTLVCVFAPNIAVLVAFRALQGLAVAAFSTTGSGVVADVFPPASRGTAMGLFMIPLLVGPLLGPVLGGFLSQAFGWRSTFICLAVFCGVLVVPLLVLVVPETHQYKVMRRLHKSDPDLARRVSEAEHILSAKPVMAAPWTALSHLLAPDIVPFALVTMVTFGSMFASLTEWPGQMAAPPYSLSESMIGVSYLAMGVAGLVGSPIGGRASDVTAAWFPDIPAARLMANALAALLVMPAGCLIYGWTLHAKTHLVGPLAGHFVIGTASAAWLAGMFGYVSAQKQANAAAASAAVVSSMFIVAGVLIFVSVTAVQRMGIARFFTLLAGVQFLLAAVAAACIWWRFRAHRQQQGQQQGQGGRKLTAVQSRSELLTHPADVRESRANSAAVEMV